MPEPEQRLPGNQDTIADKIQQRGITKWTIAHQSIEAIYECDLPTAATHVYLAVYLSRR